MAAAADCEVGCSDPGGQGFACLPMAAAAECEFGHSDQGGGQVVCLPKAAAAEREFGHSDQGRQTGRTVHINTGFQPA